MVRDFFKHYVYPVAVLAGGTIGVGFLSLPYIALKVGIWPMLFYFVVLGGMVMAINIIFGQISLKTPDFKRFPGFVGFYLGRPLKIAAVLFGVFGALGVLLVYLIIGANFLQALFLPFFGGSLLWYLLVYWALASAIIFWGIGAISKFEFCSLILLFAILTMIIVSAFFKIHPENIFAATPFFSLGWKAMFLPYGAIMFSLSGFGLIPETEEMLIGQKKLLRNVIIIATIIPAVLYLLFMVLVLGISGQQTTQVALTGLEPFLSPWVFWAAMFIGFLTTFAAFIAQGLLLKKTLMYDVGVKEFYAFLVTCLTPLMLFLLGINSFIGIISFIGGVWGGVDGVLILLMYKKIGGRALVIYPLSLIFLVGMVYQVVFFLK